MWAYALCEIGGDYATTVGNSIDDMINRISSANNTLYFHNLKFDGEFIIYWLFRNGYTFVKDAKELVYVRTVDIAGNISDLKKID